MKKNYTPEQQINLRKETIKNFMSETETPKRRRYIRRPEETHDDNDISMEMSSPTTTSSKTEEKVATKTKRKRSENRQIVCLVDRESGKLQGTYLDAGHAAHVLNLKVNDIKSDLMKGTNITKKLWLRVPAGDTIDTRDIERNAKIAYKEYQQTGGVVEKKKPGRKPTLVNTSDLQNMLKKLNLNDLDAKALKKLNSLLNPSKKTEQNV